MSYNTRGGSAVEGCKKQRRGARRRSRPDETTPAGDERDISSEPLQLIDANHHLRRTTAAAADRKEEEQ